VAVDSGARVSIVSFVDVGTGVVIRNVDNVGVITSFA
jgi:hypothetical protein